MHRRGRDAAQHRGSVLKLLKFGLVALAFTFLPLGCGGDSVDAEGDTLSAQSPEGDTLDMSGAEDSAGDEGATDDVSDDAPFASDIMAGEPADAADDGPVDTADEGPSDAADEGPSDAADEGAEDVTQETLDAGSEEDAEVGEVVSFAALYSEVLEGQGCTNGCHGGDAGGLALYSAEVAYENLVNTPAETPGCEVTMRVVPGDPEASMLWVRVRALDDDCMPKMPPGSEGLTQEDADHIYDWIATGANP